MTTTVEVNITEHDPPAGGDLVELCLTWNPVPGDEPETRILRMADVNPAQDRLANEICGTGVANALGIGPPTSLMVAWFVAGRQMNLKREPWKKLEHLFSLAAFDRAEMVGVYEVPDEDSVDGAAAVGNLADLDLEGDSEDPTTAP